MLVNLLFGQIDNFANAKVALFLHPVRYRKNILEGSIKKVIIISRVIFLLISCIQLDKKFLLEANGIRYTLELNKFYKSKIYANLKIENNSTKSFSYSNRYFFLCHKNDYYRPYVDSIAPFLVDSDSIKILPNDLIEMDIYFVTNRHYPVERINWDACFIEYDPE